MTPACPQMARDGVPLVHPGKSTLANAAVTSPGPHRLTRAGEFVPIGPATGCQLCLSDTVHPIAGCYDLNFCSGHGMCTLGSCQCLRGWSGADCSVQVRRTPRRRAPMFINPCSCECVLRAA